MKRKEDVANQGVYIFMESTNLHEVRSGGRNSLVIVGQDDFYSLAICLRSEETVMAVMKWAGPISNIHNLFIEPVDLASMEDRGEVVREVIALHGKKKASMWFVNLVEQPDGGTRLPMKPDVVNDVDAGFQMSVSGPDIAPIQKLDGNLFAWLGEAVKPYAAPKWKFPKVKKLMAGQGAHGDFLLVKTSTDHLRGPTKNMDGSKGEGAPRLFAVPAMTGKRGTAFYYLDIHAVEYVKEFVESSFVDAEQFDEVLSKNALDYQGGFICVDAREEARPLAGDGRHRSLHIAYVAMDTDFRACRHDDWCNLEDSHRTKYLDPECSTHLFVESDNIFDLHECGTNALVLSSLAIIPNHKAVCKFDHRYCAMFQGSFGCRGSYGNRDVCDAYQHNTYLGATGSHRPLKKPNKGPGMSHLFQYFQETYSMRNVMPDIRKLMNRYSCLASQIGEVLCGGHHQLHNLSVEKPPQALFNSLCTSEIFTMGGRGALFFASSKHLDGDCFNESYHQIFKEDLQLVENGIPTRTRQYLRNWLSGLGYFDSYTTCAYGSVGEPPADCEIYTYFNLNGLDVSIRMGDGVAHAFHGGQVNHSTAVSVAIVGERVRMALDSHYIVAWGVGSNAKNKARRSKRLATKRGGTKRRRN
jgi:hypothetical protein